MIEKAGEVWRCIECGRVSGGAQELVEKIGEDWICIECGRVARDYMKLMLKVKKLFLSLTPYFWPGGGPVEVRGVRQDGRGLQGQVEVTATRRDSSGGRDSQLLGVRPHQQDHGGAGATHVQETPRDEGLRQDTQGEGQQEWVSA